jgi:hypothetical protein
MATTVNITSTYAGHELREILVPMFEAMSDIPENVVLHDDVNYKKALRRITTSADLLQAESATFTPTGTVDHDEVILFPEIREVNLQLDKNDYRSEWSSKDMGKGQQNKKVVKEITDAIIKNILGNVGEAMTHNMWVGDTGGSGIIDGFKTLLVASTGTGVRGAAIKPSYVAFTDANVLARLAVLWAAYPSKLKNYKTTRIVMSPTVWEWYSDAIGNQANQRDLVGQNPMMYKGYKIVVKDQFEQDDVIIYNQGNFHFGTDVYSDYALVKLLDLTETTMDDVIRFKQKIAMDAKIGFTGECLIHYNPA